MGFRRALLAEFFQSTRPAMPPTARAERATAQSRIKRTLTMIGKPKSSVSVAQKRAKALFTAETKENMSVPSGSDFALTPKGAWGAALIVEEKKRPKSHAVSKRASPRKQGQWAGADSPAVEQHGRAPRIAAARYPPPRPRSPRGCSGLRRRCLPVETPPHLHRLRPCRCGLRSSLIVTRCGSSGGIMSTRCWTSGTSPSTARGRCSSVARSSTTLGRGSRTEIWSSTRRR